MNKRKICIVTGSRAEWGIFYPLAKEISKNSDIFTLQIIASGSHLSNKYGMTYKEIEKDGFRINHMVKMLPRLDTEDAIAKAVGVGITGLTAALKSLKPDLVFLLGDRFETFAAATAGLFLKIPIAHIHGGEITEGSMDDSLRHAITKISSLHFVSTEVYRKRVIQMGEPPETVFNVGALGLDNVKKARLLKKYEVEKRLNFKLGKKNVLITYNPPTYEDRKVSRDQFIYLLKAIDEMSGMKVIFTKPNPDMYSDTITRLIDDYVSHNRERAASFTSLGRELYLSTLKYMDTVAGNSSSGIIEVPSFGIPTVNIGNRQSGRVKGDTIVDAEGNGKSIKKALEKALSKRFRDDCKGVKNSYGDGDTAGKIINKIKDLADIAPKKRFIDLKFKYSK